MRQVGGGLQGAILRTMDSEPHALTAVAPSLRFDLKEALPVPNKGEVPDEEWLCFVGDSRN